jgi:DedD protein
MMERALKERIIGAAVLVLVVVLVVPVFLDGPPGGDEIVSKSVSLPGQAEQNTQTVVLERDREDPVPTRSTQQKTPTPKPLAQQPAPQKVETPPATPPATSTEASATGMWAVQLGSFSKQANAESLAADLRKKSFGAFLSKTMTGSGEQHRVRIGPQKDRASAEAMAAQLKKAGYEGKVMPHP